MSDSDLPNNTQNIVIVGGGMAGGLLAAWLGKAGLSVLVLDAAPEPAMPSGEAELRVSALTLVSKNMLEYVGAWQRLPQQRITPYSDMQVWDGDGTGEVGFSAQQADSDALGWMLENSAIVAALYEQCQSLNISWRSNVRLQQMQQTEAGWQLTLSDGEQLHAALLIGADGAGSFVRQQAGIPFAPFDTGHIAVVANLESEQPHQHCARQWFLSTGPLAVLPMFSDVDAGANSSLVWSAVPDEAERLMAMSETEFSQALTSATGEELGVIRCVSDRQAFPIKNLHASDYVRPHLALIGDAAHVVHPLAGQGINLGLLDAGVLAEEIIASHERELPVYDDSILNRYQRRRRMHNDLMQKSFIGIKKLFEQNQLPVRLIRNLGMQGVNRSGFIKKQLAAVALGLHGDVPKIAR